MDADIDVKTTKFKGKPVDKFDAMLGALKKKSPKGYCEKSVDSLASVSNRKICGRRSSKKNIAF